MAGRRIPTSTTSTASQQKREAGLVERVLSGRDIPIGKCAICYKPSVYFFEWGPALGTCQDGVLDQNYGLSERCLSHTQTIDLSSSIGSQPEFIVTRIDTMEQVTKIPRHT
jgi:hypothetical protein